MKKKAALLVDGGWFSKGLAKILNIQKGWPTAEQVVRNAKAALAQDEELFRIFYYDCEPFGFKVRNPVTGRAVNYQSLPAYSARKNFFKDLGQIDFVALRRGELKVRGWEFSSAYRRALLNGAAPVAPTSHDVYPNFEQKGVDMRIGIDVATLSLKKIVDRVVLFSGDTDMIPALKLARREGLQVFVVKLHPWVLKRELVEDSDGVRLLVPTA